MKIAVKKTSREVARDWNAAHTAGLMAAASIRSKIDPMVVVGRDRSYTVADGACGFAWLEIRPARGPLVTFLKKNGIGRVDHYNRCYSVSVFEFNQSIALKEAYAHAAAQSLREAGYEVYPASRLD